MNNTIFDTGIEDSLVARLGLLGRAEPSTELRANVLAELDLADRYFTLDTVAGPVYLAYNGRGISYIDRVEDVADFEGDFKAHFDRPAFRVQEPPARLLGQVTRMLTGQRSQRPSFDLTSVTDFERSVLLKALEIPYGQVRPYTWIARQIGRPKAQRAVGSALAGNPIPLLIPCHRVVRSDGIIGNYGLGGPDIKRRLLEYEGANVTRLESLGRGGFRYIGSNTTHIYCFPTCHHGHRLTEKHTVQFASIQDAQARGYRACKVCRPE